MKKGNKVRLYVKVSEFDTELKTGVITDIIKSKYKSDMYAVDVDGNIHFRWQKELKKI